MRLNKSIYVENSAILNSSRVHKNNRYVHKIPPEFSRNFSRNSVSFFTEFRGIFHGIPRNFNPQAKFRGMPRNFFDGILTDSVIPSKYNSAGICFDGIMDTLGKLPDLREQR